MHNPESVLENDTHKLLWDFDIQTDHLIIINKKGELALSCKILCASYDWSEIIFQYYRKFEYLKSFKIPIFD